jgi:hypothetical protein
MRTKEEVYIPGTGSFRSCVIGRRRSRPSDAQAGLVLIRRIGEKSKGEKFVLSVEMDRLDC